MTPRPWPIFTPSAAAVTFQHLSDTHIGYRPWSVREAAHMADDITRIGLIPPIDLMVHTGDITDNGAATEDAYAKSWLQTLAQGRPNLYAFGNHDIRVRKPAATRAEWEKAWGRPGNTYVDVKGIRFVAFGPDVDGAADSPHPGWWPPASTWAWLDGVIDAAPGPVVVVTHMPPWELGVAAVNSVQPSSRYDQLIADHPQITAILSGHMHWEIDDTRAARFVAMGGRQIPVLTDVSSMLSLDGASRDQSGRLPSISAYVTLDVTNMVMQVRYRLHGPHAWGGPSGLRVTTLHLDTGVIQRGY